MLKWDLHETERDCKAIASDVTANTAKYASLLGEAAELTTETNTNDAAIDTIITNNMTQD